MGSRAFVAKGWLLLAMAAMACTVAAAQANPANSVDYLKQGNQFSKQQKWKQAENAYRKALSLDPNSAKAHYGLGNTLAAQQDVGNAIREYERALKLNPALKGIHFALGALYESIGQLPRALEEYRAELPGCQIRLPVISQLSRVNSPKV